MKFVTDKDGAVSPVIGTILLVAITVILIVVIAAVVMPMVGNTGQTHITGIQVNESAMSFCIVSGEIPDAFSIEPDTGTVIRNKNGKIVFPHMPGDDVKLEIGEIYYIGTVNDKQTFSLIGEYGKDKQVLWTKYLDKTNGMIF